MKLLVGALEKSALPECVPFGLAQERYVGGRELIDGREFHEGVRKRAANGLCLRASSCEQARAGNRCEWHRHLQLRIIVAAGAFEGLSPAMIEDVFAAGMGFDVTGRGTEETALTVLREQVTRLPSGPATDRARFLERRQKFMRNKWVRRLSSCG